MADKKPTAESPASSSTPPPGKSAPLPVHVSVFDEQGNLHGAEEGIAAATLTPEYPVLQFGPLLDTHRLQTVLPAGVPYGVPGWIHLEVPGYHTIHERIVLAQDVGIQLVPLTPPAPVLPRLRQDGQCLRLETGARFTAIESSDFLLYQRFLNGENIEPLLTQRRDVGFNMLRIFGCYNGGLGRFIPAEYGEAYFTQLPAFYDLLARYGLYGEFTAMADSRTVYANATDQTAVWMRLGTVFPSIPNALVEMVNENDQTINTVWADLVRMLNVCASHGSNGSQAWPVEPHWDYATFHTNGAPEEQRKVGHNAMEIWGGPTLTNETSRYPDVGMWVGSGLERQKMLAFDTTAGGALLCAGSCFHSVEGRVSQLFGSATLEVARQWCRGWTVPGLDYQNHPYRHRQDLETAPSVLRAYQRGDSPVVYIHK